MAKEKMSISEQIEKEGVTEKAPVKRKPRKKKTTKETKKTAKKKQVIETDTIAEIEKEAKEIVAKRKAELPDITLPPRGYFAKGDRGTNVEMLQVALNNLLDSNIPVDGKLDALTISAVKEFENLYDGFPNGMFGVTELKAYNKLRGKTNG